jgi:hypothetical protein
MIVPWPRPKRNCAPPLLMIVPVTVAPALATSVPPLTLAPFAVPPADTIS